jgi:hypothetical protein
MIDLALREFGRSDIAARYNSWTELPMQFSSVGKKKLGSDGPICNQKRGKVLWTQN